MDLSNLLIDIGRSINPGVDMGQITGGFIQGMGWVTGECLVYNERGELLVRFAYTTGGVARRGPVTLRAQDLDRLRAAAVDDHPEIAKAVGWIGGDA